ncbi:MAG: indole-3-glycerol phosphate synthase TrpC [Aquificota bacterium]|nr:indole-3-glycerol phosphate synthase TrpC [Aquificota bacterium]
MGGFLQKVLAEKRKSIRKDPEYIRTLEKGLDSAGKPMDFLSILERPEPRIIAEVKKASPSAGRIRDVDPASQARIYERCGAVAVSVLTEERFFSGSLEDLARVRSAVGLPVLRKDFILDRVQILEARYYGADSVLIIVRILDSIQLGDLISFSLDLGIKPLVEVFSYKEALKALEAGAEILGVNSRDLDTLRVDVKAMEDLIPKIKDLGVRCLVAESGVESGEQVHRLTSLGADAVLVGTALMRSEDPCSKLRDLRGEHPDQEV